MVSSFLRPQTPPDISESWGKTAETGKLEFNHKALAILLKAGLPAICSRVCSSWLQPLGKWSTGQGDGRNHHWKELETFDKWNGHIAINNEPE